MPVSKKQQNCVERYKKAHYDRLSLSVPKGQLDTIKTAAANRGLSVNAFINAAINEAIERDNAQKAD